MDCFGDLRKKKTNMPFQNLGSKDPRRNEQTILLIRQNNDLLNQKVGVCFYSKSPPSSSSFVGRFYETTTWSGVRSIPFPEAVIPLLMLRNFHLCIAANFAKSSSHLRVYQQTL